MRGRPRPIASRGDAVGARSRAPIASIAAGTAAPPPRHRLQLHQREPVCGNTCHPNRRARLSRTRTSASARRISIPHCPQLHACRRPCLRPPNHCSGNAQHEIAAVAQPGAGSSAPPTRTAVARPAGPRPAIDPLRVPPQKNAQSEALGCSPAGRGTTWVGSIAVARALQWRARVPYRGVTPHPSLADTLKDLRDQAKY